jgi:hypothetical protein
MKWQSSEAESSAEAQEAEAALEEIGGIAVDTSVEVATVENVEEDAGDNDITVPRAEILAARAATEAENEAENKDAGTVEATATDETAENTQQDQTTNVAEDEAKSPEAESGTELQQLKEAQSMIESLADKFMPVEQAARRLASMAEEEIGQFANRQRSLLNGVSQSVSDVRNMANNIMDMTRFVSSLEDNAYAEAGHQERQAVMQLLDSVQALSRGMSRVESTTTDARRSGAAMQNELGDSLYGAIRKVAAELEGFKAAPLEVREKITAADQERTEKKKSDPNYTSNQQDTDERAMGDVYVNAGEAVSRTDVVIEEAGQVRHAIDRTLDAGNSNLTSELLSEARLSGNNIEDITMQLRTIGNRLDGVASMRSSRGNLHAELRPLVNGMLMPLVENIMRLRPPDVQSSEQPRRLNKVVASIAQMQQAASAAQAYMDSLRK